MPPHPVLDFCSGGKKAPPKKLAKAGGVFGGVRNPAKKTGDR